jgi:hypothetical protein
VVILSAGNLIGAIANTVLLGGIWVVLGAAFDKIFKVFNSTINVLPTMQDAVNGMGIMQWIWSMIMILIFFVIWLNYMMNESSQASGGV